MATSYLAILGEKETKYSKSDGRCCMLFQAVQPDSYTIRAIPCTFGTFLSKNHL